MLHIALTFYYLSFVLCSDYKKVVHIKETLSKNGDIHLSFLYRNRNLHLHLQEDGKFDRDKRPILIGENHKILTWNNVDEKEVVYSDPSHEAYFIAKQSKNNRLHEFHGMFQLGRSMNIMHPYVPSIIPNGSSARTLYIIEMDSVKPSEYDDDFQNDYPNDWVANFAQNFFHGGKLQYVVEMFVVVDNSIYESWYDRSLGVTIEDRRNNAIKQIQYYFFHVMRGIDLRYRSIKEPDYNISVRGAGIYVALTKEDSEWIEENIFHTDSAGNDWVNASEALTSLDHWLHDYDYLMPRYDQATSFTRHQLAGSWNDDGTRKRLSGLANIKGVCGFWKGSVCRDAGLYAAVQTASHELGHSLGAPHDGDGNSCIGKDQYIMAGTPDFLSTENYLHPFTFSSCSVDAIRGFLHALTYHGSNCLLDATKPPKVESRGAQERRDEKKLPGELYSLDEQCKHMYDERSYFCKSLSQYYSICRRLFCHNPHMNRCFTTSEQRAALGTPCESGKWCIHGDCVSTDIKPKPVDSCFTDDRERYYGPTACQDMVKRLSHNCYNEPYKFDCCRECMKIADDKMKGCEYGDRELFCSSISASSCYDKSTAEKCCKTCPAKKTGPSDCPYGDKATWCATISQRECYANEETCCISCKQFRKLDGDHNCRYGDQSRWCVNIAPRQCYDINDRCCDTCNKHHSGIASCPFGDRSSSCEVDDCIHGTEERKNVTCCKTCSQAMEESIATTTKHLDTFTPIKHNEDVEILKTTVAAPTRSTEFTTGATTANERERRKSTTELTPKSTKLTTTNVSPTRSTNSNCKDTASWCRTMPTRDCYVSDDTCCLTCRRANIGPTDCEYGDRVGWCRSHVTKAADCKDHIIAMECCNTCARYKY